MFYLLCFSNFLETDFRESNVRCRFHFLLKGVSSSLIFISRSLFIFRLIPADDLDLDLDLDLLDEDVSVPFSLIFKERIILNLDKQKCAQLC